MSLQNVIHRRKFIERSLMGAGGLLVSSFFLESCTDHNIPNPEDPTITLDWNALAKSAISKGLSQIPEAGEFINALIDIVWPSLGASPWDEVKAQVEALIGQKLQQDDYNRVTAQLGGLRRLIVAYQSQVAVNADVKTFWIAMYEEFVAAQDDFQQLNDELLLLPLFTQYANMFLVILRDAAKYGQSWGMTSDEQQLYVKQCQNKIAEFTDYATTWYDKGRQPLQSKSVDQWNVEPFRSTNAFDRTMTMLVLDYVDTWQYYDYTKFPLGPVDSNGTPIRLFTREIYSDPHGNIVGVGNNPVSPLVLPSPATQLPTLLTVWAGDRIDAVQLAGYPVGSGPNGATATPRMGDTNGGSAHTFNLSPLNPITQVQINTYHSKTDSQEMATDTLEFIFNDGTGTGRMGKVTGDSKLFTIQYPGYALSSIYIQGTSYWDPGKSINCIVFGFVPWPND